MRADEMQPQGKEGLVRLRDKARPRCSCWRGGLRNTAHGPQAPATQTGRYLRLEAWDWPSDGA